MQMMPSIVDYQEDWQNADAIALHVYRDPRSDGTCAFTTFALQRRMLDAETLHSPIGTPVQFAFSAALTIAKRLGIPYVIINDPAGLFPANDRPLIGP
jgi:hypothetical protein